MIRMFYCKMSDLFLFFIFSEIQLPIKIWSFGFVQTIIVFMKAQITANKKNCGKKLGFLKLPKKRESKTLTKHQKNYAFSMKKPQKNPIQQSVATFLLSKDSSISCRSELILFCLVFICYSEEKWLCVSCT